MLPALASVVDLQGRLGKEALSAVETTRAQAALDDISAFVRREAGTNWVDEEGALTDDIPDVIVAITLGAAVRAFVNPDGTRQTTIGATSFTVDSKGGAYLTDDERREIRGAITDGTGTGLWTIATYRSDRLETGSVYCPVEGGEPIVYADSAEFPWLE